ncbi:conserved hypothetical protein [Altererythrobacter sp. B11]|uniref:hypothetical protein n=1 Tax=Altererythrobacter sp. B11 TaxID=2060312 RepID=UPI000DC72FA3|nr:hypothetical protein [Altererythrobacter sp. B11]BBC71440.1 conserved hypothetical protein [Altererythrobacter sp. B11]
MPRLPLVPAFAVAFGLLLSGCVARTALNVATAPVRIVGKGVDLATTSQSEADEKRGRELRKQDERLARLQRDYDKQMRRCQQGDRNACEDARESYAAMQQIRPSASIEPDRR